MESNGLPGRMFSGMSSGMLGLEMPLHQHPNPHHQQQQQQPQNPHHLHHPQMVANYAHHDPDHHHHHHQNPQPHQSAKQLYPYATKTKQQAPVSDEDEPGSAADDGTTDGKKKTSPWQRMKWTDNMVRLLIMAVYYIGDEAGPEASDGKKKGGGAGLLQKKGKWKSVSRAMMEKGFYVSPQQCEDKFNDLNKRYKRVNDILGKGTACRVVENQSLLESMDLSPKMKDEVRKLLNSKHLFFREMCAYHNSCGHGGAGGGAQQSPEDPSEPAHLLHQQQQQVQQPCLHSSGKVETEDDDDNDEEDDDSENDDEDEVSRSRGQCGHGREDDDENDERSSQKRSRRNGPSGPSPLLQQLNHEMNTILQDSSKTPWEKKHWIKTRLMQLEEQQMNYHCQAFELEKQRLKWMKFSSKKEREMERAKLENERRRLENERMVLVIRQKELELVDLHHQQQLSSNRKADPSSITG